MAFSELEMEPCERIVKRYVDGQRPPPHIHPELDIGYRAKGQSVELFEVRTVWRGQPGEKM